MIDWTGDNWKILAGIAFFLLAIRSMEGAAAELSGRKFKLFLKRETGNRVKAAVTSMLITAVLQSSSLVNLVIMDMVGAGIVPLGNALALNLGANLGTTVNSWLVAVLGFNVNMESWIMPLTGITGIVMGLTKTGSRLQVVFRFLFSLSLLLFSLDFIKAGMGTLITHSSMQVIRGLPAFLLFGLVTTAIVQASSIVMVLALTALYTGSIPFESACAIVLGGEIGTTLKMFLAARGSGSTRKRMALGNCLFNVVSAGIAFLFLRPVSGWILSMLGARHELIALVLFQTLFNVFSLLLFLPWLPYVARFLSTRFHRADVTGRFINDDIPADLTQAIAAIEAETRNFIGQVAGYMQGIFGSSATVPGKNTGDVSDAGIDQQYLSLKKLHGLIHHYALRLRRREVNAATAARLDQLMSAVRNAMYAAKSMRNITGDIRQFRNSSNDIKYNFYLDASRRVPSFCGPLLVLLNATAGQSGLTDRMGKLYAGMISGYQASLKTLYADNISEGVNDIEITTLLNCNREIYSSFKAFFFGVMEVLLSPADTDRFDRQPGFIR